MGRYFIIIGVYMDTFIVRLRHEKCELDERITKLGVEIGGVV